MDKTNKTRPYFSCTNPECLQEFSLPAFRIAAYLHGVVFLIGEEYGYVGIVCPKCLNTTLKKHQIKHILNILDDIGNRIFQITTKEVSGDLLKSSADEYWGIINEKDISDFKSYTGGLLSQLEYDTFHHYPSDLLPSFNSHLKHRYSFSSYEDYGYNGPKNFNIRAVILNTNEASELSQSDLQRKMNGKDYYISYLAGVRFNDAHLTLFGFKEDEILNLLKIENEINKKIFPRHIYHSNIRGLCEKFCNSQHISTILNSIRPADIFEYKKVKSHLEATLKAGFEKEQISISADFMDLLGYEDFSINGHTISSRILSTISNVFKNVDLSKSLSEIDLSLYNRALRNKEKKYGDMYRHVWSSFKKDAIQIELINGAVDFAIKYRQLSKRIDFSNAMILELQQKYLRNIYRISLSFERTIIKTPKSEIREVEKAEKNFSNVRIISQDPKINELKIKIPHVVRPEKKNISVLLLGETGTGKELFAKALHQASGRSGPFVPVNCTAIANSMFESQLFGHAKGSFTGAEKDYNGSFKHANTGTIFLDEIGDLSFDLQPKLFRTLEGREIQPVGKTHYEVIDVMIIMATNQDLSHNVSEGKFRIDLYYRIDICKMNIPPLRERKDDIPLLIDYFVKKLVGERETNNELTELKFSDDCLEYLKTLSWPGNVRELATVVERIFEERIRMNNSAEITVSDVSHCISEASPFEKTAFPKKRKKIELTPENIKRSLEDNDHVIKNSATEMGYSREHFSRVYNKMRRSGKL